MTLSELHTILNSTNIPVAYNCFPTEQALPFICYLETGTDNFGADNKVYQVIRQVAIELYTKKKDIATEELLEGKLNDAHIFWNKDETYLNDNKCFEIIYTIEI